MTLALNPTGGTPREVAERIGAILAGKLNSAGSVTLTANAAETTIKNAFIGSSSSVLLAPQTANAAAAIATTYIDPADYVTGNTFVIRHANNAQVDREFGYFIVG